ncbi:Y4yA family PLP-dependent enzyme [Rhizobium oryziradicis]|uniref:Decarboxylase n=1 Tax=Rhizobium oryziradicis TaxID=1867956 RepID=A0A1Q8ZKU7_9HYPH|nr:Y4yA family PLP-dependent enzyme [Rhizobium oryziradicis]OLP42517.1 decarboxylase [Rhizobium oryziradicis]
MMLASKQSHPLSPLMRKDIADFLENQQPILREGFERFGSPLHLLWPEALKDNLRSLRTVLNAQNVASKIYYGVKVNKSLGLMGAALGASGGLDVSSLYELQDALHLGAEGRDIVATGPAKTPAFHQALLACNALISIDSVEEFDDLLRQLPTEGGPHPVLLRLRPGNQGQSRFGMGLDDAIHCLKRLVDMPALRFEGVHFHLGGYSVETRVEALQEAADLIAIARGLGLSPRLIDIGGGLPARYVDHAAYVAFQEAQTAEDYRTHRLPQSFYPYGGPIDAVEWLRRLLSATMRDGRDVASYFAGENLTLAMEPGRALADQCAVTVLRITRVKALDARSAVIFVEGSSFSACETWFASEFLVDPILLSNQPKALAAAPLRAYLAGHSCLDDDVISNRWLDFPSAPQAGDFLAYVNTGGYQMDLMENQFHRHPMPTRLCVRRTADGLSELIPDQCEETQCSIHL